MNGLVRSAQRVVRKCLTNSALQGALFCRTSVPVKRDLTRGIWHLTSSQRFNGISATTKLLHNHSNLCNCGCGLKAIHTKETDVIERKLKPLGEFFHAFPILELPGERELVEFLTEEIVAERKSQKLKILPTEVEGFRVLSQGAEVVLMKELKDEIVKITFNVNHTVDTDEMEAEMTEDKQEFAEMRSKPQFEVDLVRGAQTLGFTCSYLGEPSSGGSHEEITDVFGIDEVTMYEGEWNDKVYAVAGDVLDGYLYDLLMNLLEEKGVSNEFVNKLSDFSTAYEHAAYIALLEGMSKFTIGK